jgi:hypothetical protein
MASHGVQMSEPEGLVRGLKRHFFSDAWLSGDIKLIGV